MKSLIFFALIVSVFLLSGCASQEQDTPKVQVGVGPSETAPEEAVSEEVEAEIEFGLTVTDIPGVVAAGDSLNIEWQVSSSEPVTIKHTAIHYDIVSHAGDFSLDVAPGDSGYPSLTPDFASGEFSVPDLFSVSIATEASGILYLRAHAISDGKHYWTQEFEVPVEEIQAEESLPETQVKSFTIEGDDNGLYPDSIEVNIGDKVKITFVVREQGTYFGGLDFRSDVWGDTGKVAKGDSTTVEFIALESFEFKSYWPASNKLKATGQIVVI